MDPAFNRIHRRSSRINGRSSLPTRVSGQCLRLLAVVLCVVAMAARGAVPEDWQDRVEARIQQRDFKGAAELLDEVLLDDPLNLPALQWRAEWFARQGRINEALWQLAPVKDAFPEDRRNFLLEAQWLNAIARPDSALEVYDEWLGAQGFDGDMRVRQAMVQRLKGELPAALKNLREVLEQEPNNAFGRHSYLRTLIAAGDNRQAWRLAEQWDELDQSQGAELGLIMAQMLQRAGDLEAADRLASRPTDDPYLSRLQRSFRAMLRIKQGRQQEGLELLAPDSNLLSTDYDGLFDVGNAYAAADRINVARAYFERAVNVSPERPEARMGLARMASREGRLTDSLSRYRKIASENPQSLEAFFGVIRIARLMDDYETARQALYQARAFAPDSLELFQEELLLALEAGAPDQFDEALDRFERAHPNNPAANLWRHRRRTLSALPVDTHALLSLMDPFDPRLTATVLGLLPSSENAAAEAVFAEWRMNGTLPGSSKIFQTLAGQCAIQLNRNWTARLMALAQESSPPGDADAVAAKIPEILANGWWAYMATPFQWAAELEERFDQQAVDVWLAGEFQRRLRTLSIEAESPLEEEWLLRRSLWFVTWKNRWPDDAATAALRVQCNAMVSGADTGISAEQVAGAWRRSEPWLPPATVDFNLRVTQARWRQSRFDFSGALKLYRQLAADFPDAAEPAQRESLLLRGLGRNREALTVLRRLTARPYPNPAARLEAASLLMRLGEFQAAARQLDLTAETGFNEPVLFLRRAQLDADRGLDREARDWIDRGLAIHPGAPALLSWKAAQLLESRETRALAQLIQTHPHAAWITPDLLAAARDELPAAALKKILSSSSWWFSWRWLPWQRLEAHSLAALRNAARTSLADGEREHALDVLLPAAAAHIPDADLWLALGRLHDLNDQLDAGRIAYENAHALGLGRPDAEVAALTRLARTASPEYVAREFARRLQESPDDVGLRSGLVIALLRMYDIAAAERALAPLIENDPDSPAVKDLAAQVKGAKGRVQSARSLYASILRGDPTNSDMMDAYRALQHPNQLGFASGYEYSLLNNTVGGPDPANWQEAFFGVFWQQAVKQSVALEYRWFERNNETANQLGIGWTGATGPDWIWRAGLAAAAQGDIIPRSRVSGGTSYRLTDHFFPSFDFAWLTFSDLDVYQFAPGFSWRWHPRSTVDSKLYVSYNVLDTGADNSTLTWVLNANWEFSRQSSARLSFATGGESVTNPIRGLINNDDITSIGISYRIGLRHRWTIEPAYRFEMHQNFNLNSFGLGVVYSY